MEHRILNLIRIKLLFRELNHFRVISNMEMKLLQFYRIATK